MTRPNRIDLDGCARYEEHDASGIFSPGHLLMVDGDGKVKKHNAVGGRHYGLFAREDALQGRTVADAYASGERASTMYAARGSRVLARLKQGEDVQWGDPLASAGDGALVRAALDGGVLYANTAESAEHENTVTGADFDKSYSIPANSLRVGDVLHIRGDVTVNDNNSTDTLTLLLTIGGTTIVTSGAVDVADGDIGFFDAYVVIRSIGASGTMVANGLVGLGVPGTVTGKAFHLASTAIDTTAANVVAVNADWSVAHADNEASLTSLIIEMIRSGGDQIVAFADEDVDNAPGTGEEFIRVRAA